MLNIPQLFFRVFPIFREKNAQALARFAHEVGVLRRLRHPNLILFMGASQAPACTRLCYPTHLPTLGTHLLTPPSRRTHSTWLTRARALPPLLPVSCFLRSSPPPTAGACTRRPPPLIVTELAEARRNAKRKTKGEILPRSAFAPLEFSAQVGRTSERLSLFARVFENMCVRIRVFDRNRAGRYSTSSATTRGPRTAPWCSAGPWTRCAYPPYPCTHPTHAPTHLPTEPRVSHPDNPPWTRLKDIPSSFSRACVCMCAQLS